MSLATTPATPTERRLALAVVLVSAALFAAAVPFAKRPLGQAWAFIPVYQSALIVNDLVTALLFFGQFAFLRLRSVLVLACGYLFSACVAIAHLLSFPGLFAPAGLLGAGPQTTAWLYMFWHAGFPVCVIGYALLERAGQAGPPARRGAVPGIAAVLAAVLGFTLLATAGQEALPPIMAGSSYTPAMIFVVSSVWSCSLLALAVLWRRRPRTVLDLWLMVAMCAWLFDVALAAVLNAGRFDLGFYAGRIYGLLAATFVLLVLLAENGRLYARMHASTQALAAANKELESFSYSVSHDLRAPLRAVDGYARMLEEDYAARLDAEGRRLLAVVRDSARRMGRLIDDLLAFSRLGRQEPAKQPVDMAGLVREVVAELRKGSAASVELRELPPARADRALMRQVWVNLVGNALKYSARREDPRIEIGGREDGDEKVYWVRDNGVGFDMRYAEKLFRVFQRLHRVDEFDGTGVGLAIVERVIARHGGRVWAEARPGDGACFRFALPR